MAVGHALATRMAGSEARSLCVMSDAEINEGSTWEALLLAAHLGLDRLAVLVDVNGLQALGPTSEVLGTSGFPHAAESIGWAVSEVDGHSVTEIRDALSQGNDGRSRLVICMTTGGKGSQPNCESGTLSLSPLMESIDSGNLREKTRSKTDSGSAKRQ